MELLKMGEMKKRRHSKNPVRKVPFTMMELMVGILLIITASSLVCWKMHGMIAHKKFSSHVERLRSRFIVCHQLSINMQADWKGVWDNGVFSVYCVGDPKTTGAPPLVLDSLELVFNGKEEGKVEFEFASSGAITPHGLLEIYSKKGEVVRWAFPDFFALYEKL